LTQTMPLPAGGAGWLVLAFGAELALELDFAGFVVSAEFDDDDAFELAGAAAPELDATGAEVFPEPLEALALSVDFADLDFLLLVDLVPEDVSAAAESLEEALADFDFLELVDFVPDSESVEEAESLEVDFADLDFLEPLEALAESASEELDFAFFDFDVEDLPEDEVSLPSVELESAGFFFLVDFFVVVELVSLESEDCDCAFAGAALISAKASPAETRNARTYFFNSFMLVPPQFT